MEKIKVLFLEDVGERAGGSNSLLQLFSHIDDFIDIHIFSPKGYFTSEAKKYTNNFFYSKITRYESIVIFKRRIPNPYHILLRLLDSIKIYFYVKRNNINIVHSNDLDGHIIAWFLNHLFNIKSIWHIRIMTWPKILYKLKRVSKIIFVSETVRQHSLQGSSKKNTTVIYNGIDIDHFKSELQKESENNTRDILNITKDEFIIGYVGRVKEQKRQKILIEALNILIKKGYKVRLILVGDDTITKESIAGNASNYFNEIKDLIDQYNIVDNVDLVGHQSNVAQFYNLFDCFAFPAINDSNPRVILEAMAAKIPIIANDTGGVVDMLEDGKYGLMYSVDNAKDLSDKIELLINNNSIIDTKSAFNKLRNDYTIREHAKLILNLYKNTNSA